MLRLKQFPPSYVHKHKRWQRRGIITLETIIWLPVLAILLAAVIELGLLLTGLMHVAAASRLGAKLAAEDSDLTSTPANVATEVKTAVDDYLENAGYGTDTSAGIRIQHNVNGDGSTQASVAEGTCPEDNSPALPLLNDISGDDDDDDPRVVRVVVCVGATTVSPNLLRTFGFDTSSFTLEDSTTYPYEH